MELSILLNKMAVFVAMIVIGYVLARRGVVNNGFVKTLNKLVINVFLVGTILSSMVSTGTDISVGKLGEIVLLTTTASVLGIIVAVIAGRFVRLESNREAVYEVLMAFGNTMFIALPVSDALYGSYAVLIVSLSCIPFNVFLYSYGMWRMKQGKGERRFHLKDILSPPLIATLAGILFLVVDLPVPAMVRDTLSVIGASTMPLSLIVIGASLGSVSLLDAFRSGKMAYLSVVRLLVIPVLTWLVCGLLTSDEVLRMTCLIIGGAPCAVIVSILGDSCGQDMVFSSQAVQHSTVCSVITLPVLIQIFSNLM
ncbi:MAG: AEC family transporter [Oscillospiraceae bacterium]|nr:AEC family transporter [Oscillospiraceae bacterium]